MAKIILLRCGLANRLRTLVGFIYVGLETKQDFIFHWDINDPACNGTYSSIFEPLIIKYKDISKKIQIIEKVCDLETKYYFIGQDTIRDIIEKESLKLNNIKKVELRKSLKYLTSIESIFYSQLIPKKYITARVNNFLKYNANKNIYLAMHIRRTDHSKLAKQNNSFVDISKFIQFVEDNKDKGIFLATDEKSVQDIFAKYSNVVVYKKIKKSNNIRQTTLLDAATDIFIAATATYFMGSGYSSYSHLIEIYQRINHSA